MKQFMLFEVPDDILLQRLVEGSETAVIKKFVSETVPQGKVMASLCTSEATFKIKKAENTNKMLVMDTLKGEI